MSVMLTAVQAQRQPTVSPFLENPALMEFILTATGTGNASGGSVYAAWVMKEANIKVPDLYFLLTEIRLQTGVADTSAAHWMVYASAAPDYAYGMAGGDTKKIGVSNQCIPVGQQLGAMFPAMPIGRMGTYAGQAGMSLAWDTNVDTATYYAELRLLAFGKPLSLAQIVALRAS